MAAKNPSELTPNTRLRAARLGRSSPTGSGRPMSRQELADAVNAYIWDRHRRRVAIDANYVGKLERGEHRWPQQLYREAFRAVLGVEADSAIGFYVVRSSSARPEDALALLQPSSRDAVASVEVPSMGEAGLDAEWRGLLELVGHGRGSVGLSRAVVLRGLFALGALPIIAPLLSGDLARLDPPSGLDVDSFETIARCHQRLYWSAPAGGLYDAAYAHTTLGTELMRRADGAQRIRLAGAVAESALLTARLAFFDLGRRATADECLDLALASSREAHDRSLMAAVLAHKAFVYGFGGQPEAARSVLATAMQHARHGVAAVVLSWLHCVASEVEGHAGFGTASRRHIDLAMETMATDEPPPAWLDFYDRVRLDAFAGQAAIVSGDTSTAAEHLSRALAGLGPSGTKQSSVILADLAAAYAGDGDQAAAYLTQALDALRTHWYGTGLDRVRAVRPVLSDSRHAQEIDDRIGDFAASRLAIEAG